MSDRKVSAVVIALAAAHFINDAFTNIYAPLLPMLVPRLGMSLASAGGIAMAFQVSNSVGQMLFGPLADRWRPSVLAIGGPFLAVAAMSLVGVASTPTLLALVVVIGGLGSAAFHPASASLVHSSGVSRRGLAMSVHVTGGAAGGAFGPLIFAPYAQRFGLGNTPLAAVPALLALFWIQRAIPNDRRRPSAAPGGFGALRPFARPLALLWSAVVLRTAVALGFSTFLPILLTQKGQTVGEAGIATGIYLLAGSIGGLVGGPVADRIGARRVMAWSLFLSVPLQLVAVSIDGPAAAYVLAVGGFFLGSTLPVNVTYAHMIAPVATGTVSSLMLGVAWGAGGLAIPLVGTLGDGFGLTRALQVVACLPALAAVLTMLLPAEDPCNSPVT